MYLDCTTVDMTKENENKTRYQNLGLPKYNHGFRNFGNRYSNVLTQVETEDPANRVYIVGLFIKANLVISEFSVTLL